MAGPAVGTEWQGRFVTGRGEQICYRQIVSLHKGLCMEDSGGPCQKARCCTNTLYTTVSKRNLQKKHKEKVRHAKSTLSKDDDQVTCLVLLALSQEGGEASPLTLSKITAVMWLSLVKMAPSNCLPFTCSLAVVGKVPFGVSITEVSESRNLYT